MRAVTGVRIDPNVWLAKATRVVAAAALASLAVAFSPSAKVQQQPDLIIVQVPAGAKPESPEQHRLNTPLDRYVDSSRIVLLPSSGRAPVVLTAEFAAACDPDVSSNGRAIVFAGKRSAEDSWQIWRMNADGSEKVQITRGEGDAIAPVFAGARFYLDDAAPTPQIVFAATAHGWTNEQGDGVAFSLYGTDHNGETTRRLTFNLSSDFSPDVLPDGRIVFASWQHYGDRYAPDGVFALMAVNIDGTDLMPYYGNHEMPRYKDMVHASDAGDRVYFVESDRLPWLGGGDIAYVSRRRPLHSYRKLSQDSRGFYHSPAHLPDNGLVASYRPDESDAVFGIYRIDPESGRRERKLFEEAGWHSIDAQVLDSRPAIKGKANWLIPGSTAGAFYCLDSYTTNLHDGETVAPGTIKHVRVIEGIPMRGGVSMAEYQPGSQRSQVLERYSATAFGPRRLLGLAPVEADGSFHVRVPAETPITFQLLDENYLALRTQRAWTWVMGNETRGCVGCHEDRELSPPNRLATAVTKPAVDLTLPPARRRTVDFRHEIAQLIAETCATGACHGAWRGVSAPADAADAAPASALTAVYHALLGPIPGSAGERYVVPGNARESPLIWSLFGGRMGSERTPYTREVRQMPPGDALRLRERILFIEWVDLGAQWDARTAASASPSASTR